MNDAKELTTDDIELSPEERIEKYLKPYLFTKREDYKDEQEYRIGFYHNDYEEDKSIKLFFKESLIGVIVGCKIGEVMDNVLEEMDKNFDAQYCLRAGQVFHRRCC